MVRFWCLAAVSALAVAIAAAPLAAQPDKVVTMSNGASQPLTYTVPGHIVTGSYKDIDNGADMTVLNPGGEGSWRGDRRDPMEAMKWGIAADASGKPLIQEAPNGQALILVVDFGDGKYHGFQLAIAREPKAMYINGDRVKKDD